jgi:hypothetical protein
MTRKNYIATAAIINARLLDSPNDDTRKSIEALTADLADMFRADNVNFSYGTFYRACGMDVPSHHAGRR